ncbi:MAG TPA: UbiA family prenyltransferase [Rhodanobacteraceae bacterium]
MSNDARAESAVPLCVDLDGTLIHSDLLIESALALIKRNPLYLFRMLLWLARGRANLKREVARRAKVDVATLPWDSRVVALLNSERPRRPLVLCTASDQTLADAVARHMGCFARAMGSDGTHNLAGRRKAAALVEAYGEHGFDYAGNATPDLAIWAHARRAYVVNASAKLADRAGRVSEVARLLPRGHTGLRLWIKALRLHQWAKNVLVFAPLLAAHMLLRPVAVAHAVAAFVIFGCCASGVYVLNDLLDLSADRAHPRKRKRPFASGRLPLTAGLAMAPLLTVAAFVAAYFLAPRFALALLGYYVLTLAYSFKLKQIAMLDVLVLAGLYTLRIIAGTVAIGVASSFWLLAFSMFLFLSLALVKRYTELVSQRDSGKTAAPGRGYAVSDASLLATLGGASGYLSVLVLALYIDSTASAALYRHPQWLWLMCPLLLYWVSRVWIIAHRGAMDDDPVVFAMKDNVSRIVLVLAAAVVVVAIL